jgi:hypothetical protein
MASQSRVSSSGPFTVRVSAATSRVASAWPVMCPTCPSVPATACQGSSPAHLPTSAPFRVPARVRYPVSYPPAPGWRSQTTANGFLSPFGHRHSLLGHPLPAREFRSPHGRPTKRSRRRDRPDPVGVPAFRTHKTRPGWVPSLSRDQWCSPGRLSFPGRHCRLPKRPVLNPAGTSHPREARLHKTSPRVHVLHPSGLPLTGGPWMDRRPLGFTLGFGPRGHPRRPPGRGQALSTGSELHLRHQPNLQSIRSLAQCDLASHKTPDVKIRAGKQGRTLTASLTKRSKLTCQEHQTSI